MRSPYEEFSVVSDKNYVDDSNLKNCDTNNTAIPYHARVNSLPFSYGEIGKTSTPLRNGTVGGCNSYLISAAATTTPTNSMNRNRNGVNKYDLDRSGSRDVTDHVSVINNDVDRNYNYDYNYNRSIKQTTTKTESLENVNDANMIKKQPRLTSPLLVRKTLNTSNSNSSRSPTRYSNNNSSSTNTNTISNIYHFKHQLNDGRDNELSGKNNNSSSYNSNINIYNTGTLRKTPTRSDFEELLRERRDRVYDEYNYHRSTVEPNLRQSTSSALAEQRQPPQPPQRQYRHPSLSTAPMGLRYESSSNSNNNNSNSQQQATSKYSYDFEFNLNLDDLPQRANTMDRTSQQQYRTRNIPLPREPVAAPSTYVERNYHTISSTNAIRETNQLQQRQQQYERDLDHERSTLEFRRNQSQQFLPQRQHATSQRLSPQRYYPQQQENKYQYQQILRQRQQQQQQQPQQLYNVEPELANANTTYGIENVGSSSGYYSLKQTSNVYGGNNNSNSNYNSNNRVRSSLEEHNRNNLLKPTAAAPIYATTTKQAFTNHRTVSSTKSAPNTPSSYLNINGPELSIVDYASSASKVSPSATARPETPAFPVTPRTPYPYTSNGSYNEQSNSSYIYSSRSPIPQQHRFDTYANGGSHADIYNYSSETIDRTAGERPRLNSSLSMGGKSTELQEVAAHLVKFAKDSSKFWYKPNLTREEAIMLLLHAAPGTFVVRDSTTYKNAYGLVVRVAHPPPGTQNTGKPDELVRHFLIEPTTRGVRLKGCANEPVFTSLSALVYEHSINQLALPCLLRIPEQDLIPPLTEPTPAQRQLLTQGAACNVLWLYSCETESLTGEEAIRKAIRQLYAQKPLPVPTEVHFKVSQQGITLTDNTRKVFFRKHYAADIISYCAIDPDHRMWTMTQDSDYNDGVSKKNIFAFIARRSPCSKDNQCHVFCDLAINQPASAIVSFVNKTLPTEQQRNYVL